MATRWVSDEEANEYNTVKNKKTRTPEEDQYIKDMDDRFAAVINETDPATMAEYRKILAKGNKATPNEIEYLKAVRGEPNAHVQAGSTSNTPASSTESTEKPVDIADAASTQYRKDKDELINAIKNDPSPYTAPTPISHTGINTTNIDSTQVPTITVKDAIATHAVSPKDVKAGTVDNSVVDTTKYDEARRFQIDLANQLAARSKGEGPSIAASQLKDALERSTKQKLGAAASLGNSPMAQKISQQNLTMLQQEASNQAAQLKLAEAIEAQKQLTTVSSNIANQDISVAMKNAEFEQDANKTNVLNRLTADIANMNKETEIALGNASQDTLVSIENMKADLQAQGYNQKTALEIATKNAENKIAVDQFNKSLEVDVSKFNTEELRKYQENKAKEMVDKYRLIGENITMDDAVLKISAVNQLDQLRLEYEKLNATERAARKKEDEAKVSQWWAIGGALAGTALKVFMEWWLKS